MATQAPKMPGLVRHPKAGQVSAACKRKRCDNCYKLDCPHKCHKDGK